MTKHDQGISREGLGEEQPKDKERARTASRTAPKSQPKTDPGHMPPQPNETPTKPAKSGR